MEKKKKREEWHEEWPWYKRPSGIISKYLYDQIIWVIKKSYEERKKKENKNVSDAG